MCKLRLADKFWAVVEPLLPKNQLHPRVGTSESCLFLGVVLLLIGGCHTPGTYPIREQPPAHAAASPSVENKSDALAKLPKHIAQSLRPAMYVLRSADVVESYRIGLARDVGPSRGIMGYPVIARGPPLDEAATRLLRNLILDPRGYNGELWCGEIEPGLAFRFVSGERVLTVLICFKCQEWEFWLNGERLGKDRFGGLQPELLRLVQRTFPTDQSLSVISPSETYGRIYHVEALRAERNDLSNEQRSEIISEWEKKITNAVGDLSGWREAGGIKHALRVTEDEAGMIVITTAKGHAAITSLDGIKVMPLID